MVEAPMFEVDPLWPKPLPNGWLMGMTIGVGVDSEDHVWIVHRPDTLSANEVRVAPRTRGDGSTWDVAFSRDPEQKYLFLADGKNEKIYVMLRESLEILTMFGDGGRQPGQFFAVHGIATDSKGNLYTTETYAGRRLQKFAFKGIGMVPRVQGVVWPKR